MSAIQPRVAFRQQRNADRDEHCRSDGQPDRCALQSRHIAAAYRSGRDVTKIVWRRHDRDGSCHRRQDRIDAPQPDEHLTGRLDLPTRLDQAIDFGGAGWCRSAMPAPAMAL